MKPLFSSVSLWLAALLLAACGDTPTEGDAAPVVTPLQSELVGVTGLYQPRAGVRVTDATGEPLSDVTVQWSTDSGGRLDSPTSVTNQRGEALAGWVLGSTPGEQSLVARVPDGGEATITTRAEAAVRLVLPAKVGVRNGDTTSINVYAWTGSGHEQLANNELLSWELGDSSIVEVLPNGRLRALASGETAVTVRLADVSARTTMAVDAPFVELWMNYRGYVLPDTVLEPEIFARDAFSNRVTPPLDSVEWSSSSPAATVDAAGRVTTHHAGTAAVVARYDGLADTVVVRVRDAVRVVDASPLGAGVPCVYAPDGLRCWTNVLLDGRPLARLYPFGGDLAGVRLGRGFGCGLEADGAAVCWGDGELGQTGLGSPADSTGPAPVAGGRRFTALTAGWDHACGLDVDGRVLCWGRNDAGQLGAASAESCGGVDCSATPVPVDLGGSRAVQVEAGAESACALLEDGGVTCWGDLERDGVVSTPAPLPGSTRFRSIDVGRTHACGLSTDSEAFCWGEGRVGQLGNGGQTASESPVAVAEPGAFASLSVSGDHACALTDDGAAYCWGDNSHGQLGYGTQEERHRDRPTPVLTERRFTTVAAAGVISCGVVADGRMFCWGQAYSLGNPGVESNASCAHGPHGTFPCVPHPTEPVLAGLSEDGGW